MLMVMVMQEAMETNKNEDQMVNMAQKWRTKTTTQVV